MTADPLCSERRPATQPGSDMRHVCLLVLLGSLLAAAPAAALVVPAHDLDGTLFPHEIEHIQIVGADIRVDHLPSDAVEGVGQRWEVTAELRVRNHQDATTIVPLIVLDDADLTDQTRVFVDGVAIQTTAIDPGYDPAHRELVYEHGRHFDLAMAPFALMAVRVTMVIQPEVDSVGQVFLRLPTDAFALFDGPVPTAFLDVELDQRAIGLQASLTGYTLYDEPENRLVWFVLDWTPSRPLEIAYVPAWSALLLVATVEACPEPWAVVQHMTTGDIAALRTLLDGVDTGTLEFCAALPLMIHGYRFDSSRVREQFGAVALERYLPGERPGESIYRENPAFTEEMLGEIEAIYRRTLAQFAEGG